MHVCTPPAAALYCIEYVISLYLIVLQRFAGRLSEENRQGAPCGFVMYMCIV